MALAQNPDAARSSDWAFKQLFKLESECRSQVPASQVQAIGQFSKLFDQFPFPTLVSSAFLKLGDLFRSSPNSLRFHIAQVFEASQHHLPQITHTEELLKRVLGVLYSNDPIARALALRLIGNGSIVFAKYPEAQHGVLLRYQSTHPLEIAAAVQTTQCMLDYSPGFLAVVWETVIGKAGDTRMLDSVRAQLIRSLQHAARNLQLSTVLYERCRTWMSQPDSTIVVQNATMATWRAIVQPHNELKLEDAEFVSCYVDHNLSSTRRGALRLLLKWMPVDQVAAMGFEEGVDIIKDRLVSYIRAQLRNGAGSIDLYCVRLALIVLARAEAAAGFPGVPECWELAEAFSKWSLCLFSGSVPRQQSVLEFIQSGMCERPAERDLEMGERGCDDQQRAAFESGGVSDCAGGMYHQLAAAAMLAVNVATTLAQQEYREAAAVIVARSWQAIARVPVRAGKSKYTRCFLRTSWRWCRSVGMASAIVDSVYDMLGSPNQYITHATVTIAAAGLLGAHLAGRCIQLVEASSASLARTSMTGSEQRSIWCALAVILAHSAHIGNDPGQAVLESANPLVIEAVAKWSAHVALIPEDAAERSTLYARSGPPAHLCQKIISLLAAGGSWLAVGLLCKALPTPLLSDQTRGWVHAMHLLADAECARDDSDAYISLAGRSQSLLRILDNQGLPRLYQLYIVQLRTEMVRLLSGWRHFQPTAPPHPSSALVARSLISRTHLLADQTNLVLQTFMTIDEVTREWLAQVQTTLGAIISAATECGGCQRGAQPSVLDISKAVRGSAECQTPELRLGPSFFSTPLNPGMSIETRPDMDGAETTVTVLSGSQFHLIVEGFLRLPKCKLPASPRRIRVAAWLSKQPQRSSNQDLLACSKQNAVARSAQRPTPSGRSASELAAGEDAAWDNAIAFEADLDGAYFECPCAIPTPSLRALFGEYDTNIVAHVHISCALIDDSGCTWWIGPHKSYPLMISTTARA
ncbi:hypothetical protein LPJ66_004349 [Kickxella alabastrina]|uniref:Uncharacterized protein n=1 Tax=Kickxella alabastrina TaxID=61397 RepID=A0ACC1ILJ3_9FUNG|nr:hypothetical protein LPJ66_004349 [Kickxella alabastrina]